MNARARLSTLCLLLAAASAQEAQAPAAAPRARFAERDAAAWAERLRADERAAIDELAAGQPASLPVLAELLGARSETIAISAARVCARIGPAAAPLLPALERELRTRSGWYWRLSCECADAARAIGVADAAMVATLFAKTKVTREPYLRHSCALAYERLQPDAVACMLAAASRGEFPKPEFAVDALACLGERAAPVLAERLHAHGDDDIARKAVEAIGWRAVPALERAGLTELAASILRDGALRHVTFHELFTAEEQAAPATLPRLPAIAWEHAAGHHGTGFTLLRAAEDAHGLRVDEIALVAEPRPHVRVRTATLPRERAMALARQLAVVARTRLVPKDDWLSGSSNGSFFARVRVAAGNDVLLDATFGGDPTAENTPQRLQPQAASGVLWEAFDDANWTEREATADERAAVDARCREKIEQQPEWVAERLQQLRTLLAPK